MPDLEIPPDPILRDYVAEVDDVDASRHWVVARITTDAVDNYKTVVEAGGIDRSEYLKNPIVLWNHGKDVTRGLVPIGRNSWLKPGAGGKSLVAKTIFADDEFSRGLFDLYRDNVLRGWSINGEALPGCGPPTAAEIKARPILRDCKYIYRSVMLREYSAVAIPGNSDALTEAVSRGMWMPDALRAMLPPLPSITPTLTLPALPPLRGRTLDDVAAALERSSRNTASELVRQALQDARDLARGRI